MANIIPYDDTPIVDEKALAKTHTELVNKLKESLFVGQVGFIKAGQHLNEIKEKETYKSEDSQHDTKFREFLMRPDLPLSGITPDGRERMAQRLMAVWRNIASQPGVKAKDLAEIGYTKLALVAGVLNRDPKAKLDEWLTKAKELSTTDLSAEASDGGQTLAQLNDCKHKNYHAVDAWRCDDCKRFLKEEPGKTKKNVKTKK